MDKMKESAIELSLTLLITLVIQYIDTFFGNNTSVFIIALLSNVIVRTTIMTALKN